MFVCKAKIKADFFIFLAIVEDEGSSLLKSLGQLKNKESSSESDNEENSREDNNEDNDIFSLVPENDENNINGESLD